MKLYIKYMVSRCCKLMVKAEIERQGLHCVVVDLGEIEILEESLTPEQFESLKVAMLLTGHELMEDKKAIFIEKIKTIIVEMVHYTEEVPKVKNSEYLSEKLHYDYTYLANLFSEATGITIEHYIIDHKIERVKELIIYDELNLTEIAYLMNYSSVAHLSNQFKKVTGLTPSFYKQLKEKKRSTLDQV